MTQMSKIEQFESIKRLSVQIIEIKNLIRDADANSVVVDVNVSIFIDNKKINIPSQFQPYINKTYSRKGDVVKSINDAANAMLSDLDTLRQQARDEFEKLVGP